jgi:ribosomal protein L11 methylase PrmA
VRQLGADETSASTILDLGCGTGASGAAWAVSAADSPSIIGIDRHPWAVEEARWTYQMFGLRAQVRRGDLTHLPTPRQGTAVLSAYVMNELPDVVRRTVEDALVRHAERGQQMLIVEPIARSVTPWWDETARRVATVGGRADEWRFAVELPPLLQKFDKAAGLNHRQVTLRSLYCPAATG